MAKESDLYREKFRPDTDPSIDREVDAVLADVSLEALYSADARPAQGNSKGARKGRVISVDKDDVFLDLGGKDQGIVSLIQFEEEPKVGQEIDVHIDRYDRDEGMYILNRKGAAVTNVSWDTLVVGQVVEGVVKAVNKGGLEVEVKGLRAFMPSGQVDIYHVPDLTQFIEQKILAEVMKVDREARNIVLSRRMIVEREREESKTKLLAELSEGQIRRGTVRSVLDFGAFVDLGGVDGLIHISELTFRRGVKASEIVKQGDVVDVKVLKIDKESGKLSLSLKQARGIDPWSDAGSKYAVGTPLTGRVVKVEEFGAFIEVEEGVEGLLPVSEISWQRIKRPHDLVHESDTIRLVVIAIDTLARRMTFSMKQAGPDPWKQVHDSYATNTVVTGKVTRTADFGAFVELEAGLEGLIHISELSPQRVRQVSDVVKAGDEVRVRILEIDADNRRMGLSLKRADMAPTGASAAGAPAPAEKAPPSKSQLKKKKPQLRGGLDF